MTLRPLKAAVGAWQPADAPAPDPLAALRAAWPLIVGADVARNTHPAALERGALLVYTRSSAWSQQLSFLSERIIAAANARTGNGTVERVRFRVGRVAPEGRRPSLEPRWAKRPRGQSRHEAATLDDAFARFRTDVQAAQRAKAAAGWKECLACNAHIAPGTGSYCVPCANARSQRCAQTVARLLFDAPWLGYAGVRERVEELTPQAYEAIRKRLLAQWWDTLLRLQWSGRQRMTRRERAIASSYVLLKSGLDPETIAPAVVRDLLGDRLHDLIYGRE